MRALILLTLTLLALVPFARAQAPAPDGDLVEITNVEHPSLVAGDKAFPVTVTLRSKANEEVRAHPVGALYRTEQGKPPCGSQLDERWLGATHKTVGDVTLRPGETVAYPSGRGSLPWWHEVNASWLPDEAAKYEMCIFAVRPGTTTAPPLALDYHSFEIAARGLNRPPQVAFQHNPLEGNETYPVTFTATATDVDGDALRYAWDFGYIGAQGRAQAQGRVVQHAFYPAGEYAVTLTVTDGFDATTVTKTIKILPESVPALPAPAAQDKDGPLTPAPGVLLALAAGVAGVLFSRKKHDP